ncbi:MAG TPA: ROK family protein [Aggregatilineaceae bacterium]|nr:ROK family protein [Aggregatilineaceae bacterium]
MSITVGIDVGGTKIAAGWTDETGHLAGQQTAPTPAAQGRAAILEQMMAVARAAIAAAPEPVRAIGVATGGQVDVARGVVMSATGLLPGWSGLNLRAELEAALHLPVAVDNDVKATGLAEVRIGAGRDKRHVLCVAVGTGIGGAIFIDGAIYRGAGGFAGEVGHIPIKVNGRPCTCGNRGCIEAYASGPALARDFARRAGRARLRSWFGKEPGDITALDVAHALTGDNVEARDSARQAVAATASLLGQVLGGLLNLLNPEIIVLGGGLTSGLGAIFIDSVRAGATQTALPPVRDLRIVPAALGASAGVIGAALVAREQYKV